jgi:hypothetical protein
MAIWFTRWPQCADTAQTAGGIAILCWKHQQLIVETTCCAREPMPMRGTMEAR